MRVLALNPGSNSLKFDVIDAEPDAWGRKILTGGIDPIGTKTHLRVWAADGTALIDKGGSCETHQECIHQLMAAITGRRFRGAGISGVNDLDLVVCRVVHGGSRFTEPVKVNSDVIDRIEELDELAPLHNAASVSILRVCRATLSAPIVAIFDTAFHRTLPERAYRYAIPWDLAERHQIRKFGFHGLSHEYMMRRYAEVRGISIPEVNIVTLHLEGGASAAAIHNGCSIDTSMGMTPLEGLMMGTRCGDLDPALIGFLVRKERVDIATVEKRLNRESGLLGVSGESQDTRALEASDTMRARLALEMFSYRVLKYAGSYLAALNGADAVIFGGGIGENTSSVRAYVCEGLRSMGMDLDDGLNAQMNDQEGCITRAGSRLQAYVIPTEEGLMMARQAVAQVLS